MATITRDATYHCSDDCVMSGCPSHKAVLTFQSTSDAYAFDDGNGHVYGFERNALQTLINLLKSLDRADSVQVI